MSNEQNFDWEQPDDFGGGNFLKIGGTYHLLILDIATEDKDGKLIDGFRVNCEVVDGTQRDKEGCTETKKTTGITFYNGKMSNKDGGRFLRQRQAAFFVAANILTPQDIPAILAKKVKPDLSLGVAQQFIATIVPNEKGYMDLNGHDIYHVDDPAARGFPKDAACLDLIPKENRRKPEELQAIKDAFAGKSASGANDSANGSANGSGGHANAKQPAAAVNLDEI